MSYEDETVRNIRIINYLVSVCGPQTIPACVMDGTWTPAAGPCTSRTINGTVYLSMPWQKDPCPLELRPEFRG